MRVLFTVRRMLALFFFSGCQRCGGHSMLCPYGNKLRVAVLLDGDGDVSAPKMRACCAATEADGAGLVF